MTTPSIFDGLSSDVRLTVVIVGILLMTFLAAWLVNRLISERFKVYTSKAHIDVTTVDFVRRLSTLLIYILGFSSALTQIPEFKIIGHSLLAGAGILTVIGGLASQQVLSNLVSGFLIIFFRPFKVGDRVTINNTFTGIVEDITLRQTVLRDFENNRVIIPNSVVSSEALVNMNHTDGRVCKFIDIGIGYTSDTESAMAIMAEEIIKHPLHIDSRTAEQRANGAPEAVVRLIGLGNSTVNLRGWAWADNAADGFVLQCDLLQSIKRRYDQAGIEIPFPQTTVSFAKNENVTVSVAPGS
jgi:small conductance mechanosensitive channel